MATSTGYYRVIQRRSRHEGAGAAWIDNGQVGMVDLCRHFRRLEDLFSRAEPCDQAFRYLCDLLALPAEKCSEDGRNRLLTTARWDEDQVRDRTREMVVENLGSPEAVLVITEEGFVKKGRRSAGVDRQYCLSAERVGNYQIGLFLLYSGRHGAVAAIDRELLLPPSWERDADRRATSGIPDQMGVRAREDLALAMVDRALDAQVPAGWLVTDSPWYGDNVRLRAALEKRRLPYVLASGESIGFAAFMQADAVDGFVRYLLPRRDGGCYLAFVRGGTLSHKLIEAASKGGLHGPYFASARGDAGMDRYAARQWRAWYRHMSLVMFAHASMTVSRGRVVPNGRR